MPENSVDLEALEKVNTQIEALNAEWEERQKSAQAHEAAAKEDRLRMSELRQRRAELSKVLANKTVIARVTLAQQEIQASVAEAKKDREDAAAMRKEAEALLAKLKSQDQPAPE